MKISPSSFAAFVFLAYTCTSVTGTGTGTAATSTTTTDSTINSDSNVQMLKRNTLQSSSSSSSSASYLFSGTDTDAAGAGGVDTSSSSSSSSETTIVATANTIKMTDSAAFQKKLEVGGNIASAKVHHGNKNLLLSKDGTTTTGNYHHHDRRHRRRNLPEQQERQRQRQRNLQSSIDGCDAELGTSFIPRNDFVCDVPNLFELDEPLLVACTSDVDSSVVDEFPDICLDNGFLVLDYGDLTVSCDAELDGSDVQFDYTFQDEQICVRQSCVGVCVVFPSAISDTYEEILAVDPELSNVSCRPQGSGANGCDMLGEIPQDDTTTTPTPTTARPTPSPTPSLMSGTGTGTGSFPGFPSLGNGGNDSDGDDDDDGDGGGDGDGDGDEPTAAQCVDTKIVFVIEFGTSDDEWFSMIDYTSKTVVISPGDSEENKDEFNVYTFEDCLFEKCLTFDFFDDRRDGGFWEVIIEYGSEVYSENGDESPNGFYRRFGWDCPELEEPADPTPMPLEVEILTGSSGASDISLLVYDESEQFFQFGSPLGWGSGVLVEDEYYPLSYDAVGCVKVVVMGATADNLSGVSISYDGEEVFWKAPEPTGSFDEVLEVGSQC